MSYTAIVTREGGDWLGDVPALQGASTYGTTLGNLIANLQEVIILAEDLPDDAVPDLDLDIQADDPALRQAVQIRNRRRELEHEMSQVHSETRRVVAALVEGGYSVRDTAAAVGVTSGRVSQLTRLDGDPGRSDVRKAAKKDAGRNLKKKMPTKAATKKTAAKTAARESG